MSGISLSITSGDQAQTASPAAIPCVVACAQSGAGEVYAFDAGQDVAGSLGGGLAAEAAYALLRTPGVSRVLVAVASGTWSNPTTIVKTGTGPTVSIETADGESGCYDDHSLLVTVKRGGVLGASTIGIAYDGVTEIEEIPTPVEQPAVVTGTVNLSSSVPAMTGLTLVFSSPSSTTITFATSPSTSQELADTFNTLAAAAPLAVRARVHYTSSGEYFQLYSTAVGALASVTVSASSTGEGTLGLSTTAAEGAAATLILPKTGCMLTFASGTYVAGDTYTSTLVGPKPSLAQELAALNAAVAQYGDQSFGFALFPHPSASGAACAARQAAISSRLAELQADSASPICVYAGIAGPLHTASSTLTTNDTNIATADTALLTAFASSTAALDSVIAGDFYLQGATSLRSGSFRRSAAIAWAMRRASAAKLADDVGSANLPEGSLLAPDGVTRARDEARATVKLGGGAGPGFSVLKSTVGGLRAPRFEPGTTRAGSSSRLRYSGVVAVAKEAARLLAPIVSDWRGQTWPTDPSTRQLLDGEKTARAAEVKAAVAPTFMQGESLDTPLNVSAYDVQILNPSTGVYLDNGQMRVRLPFVPLGEVESVDVEISATGTIIAG